MTDSVRQIRLAPAGNTGAHTSKPHWLGGLLIVIVAAPACAKEFHVSPSGSDSSPGAKAKPFRTIQKAADVMAAGDTCYIRAGTYRQTVCPKRSGRKGKPIRFVAAERHKVVLDGTEPVRGKWSLHKGNIYKTNVKEPFEQLFVDGKMMIEARWPNMRFDQILARSCWASAGEGSRYGKMVDPQLAGTGIDWTGALATLNVAHQFYTWTRNVEKHAKGSDTFTYARNLKGITHYADKTKQWEDDCYYLSGKLEALDAPGEWFHDEGNGVLYLYPPDGKSPAGRSVTCKRRNYAFDVDGCDYIELRGLRFFAATFRFSKCNHCVVADCRVAFATYSRRITEFDPVRKPSPATGMQGDHNVVRGTAIAYSNTSGLNMLGRSNTVENCIIHDVCWNGSLTYTALNLTGPRGPVGESGGSVVRRNTMYNAGNAILNYRRGSHIIEYNHVYNGGLVCKDVALVYTGQPSCAGSIVRYNWVHGCRTEGWSGRGRTGGLGIRGDDQTRRLTVHHNVVWDCGRDGIIVKGDHNRVYNNTVLNIGTKSWTGNYISLHTAAEPKKPWRRQFPLLKVQNAHSEVFNNAARTITANQKGKPFPQRQGVANNYMKGGLMLADPAKFDFRPKAGSPLIDAGRIIKGFTDGYKGKAPDIGAYEFTGENWTAGADWEEEYRKTLQPRP